MKPLDPKVFHQLYGPSQKRAVYFKRDFSDYLIMMLMTAGVLVFAYGPQNPLTWFSLALCVLILLSFMVRLGVEWKVPVLLRRPQELLYMFAYKIKNISWVYLMAVAFLIAENAFIYYTPQYEHRTELMHTIAMYGFFIHLGLLSLYRTVSLFAHLQKKEIVREFLMQTPWKKTINADTNMTLEIFHAYITGLLTHIVLLAPWFVVITYAKFSVLVIPVAIILNIFTQAKWLKEYNKWFYRDHWLGHNSEFEFLYLHGSHHDALPLGMIGVAGNGFLEGFMRHTMGSPLPFYNPVFTALMYSMDVKNDIDLHQYIPAIFPRMDMQIIRLHQHSMHHLGRLEPYSFGTKFDQEETPAELRKKIRRLPEEVLNSVRYDEELNGFEWDNKMFRNMLELFEKYDKKG